MRESGDLIDDDTDDHSLDSLDPDWMETLREVIATHTNSAKTKMDTTVTASDEGSDDTYLPTP